jgi:hypothetical protein
MSEQPQVISDLSDLRKYRIELPNLADDGELDPFEFRLLVHYKRVGTCTEGLETTAKKCRMSEGKVSQCRQSLADKGWIVLQRVSMDEGRYRFIVTVADRWLENFARYSGISTAVISEQLRQASTSPREGSPSPHEASPSPREGKNKPIKNLKDSLSHDFAKMTVVEAMRVPNLRMYWNATGFFPGSGVWSVVDEFIRDNNLTEEKIGTAYKAWLLRGHRQENIEGILEWARDGVPQSKSKSKRSKSNGHSNSDAIIDSVLGA